MIKGLILDVPPNYTSEVIGNFRRGAGRNARASAGGARGFV